MKVLITGSMGLVGSEAVRYYLNENAEVIGIDNDMRKHFFGESASVANNRIDHRAYKHFGIDISKTESLFEQMKPDLIIHCAAQPSHDWAAKDPLTDFGINAYGTLMLLEFTRKHCPEAVFIQVSTNKVYGDRPNHLTYREEDKRYELYGIDCVEPLTGFNEKMSVDQCLHSLFGVSKLSGDLLAQEYGKYFGINTGIFRCGCITGAAHAGAELHGFLSYMVKCKKEKMRYKIYGYKGKQVRDQLHARDLVTAFHHFFKNPKPSEVYNMGGGRHANISVLEAINWLKMKDYEYVDEARIGDHIWWISDTTKFETHYPEWKRQYNLWAIFDDLLK